MVWPSVRPKQPGFSSHMDLSICIFNQMKTPWIFSKASKPFWAFFHIWGLRTFELMTWPTPLETAQVTNPLKVTLGTLKKPTVELYGKIRPLQSKKPGNVQVFFVPNKRDEKCHRTHQNVSNIKYVGSAPHKAIVTIPIILNLHIFGHWTSGR